MSHQSDPSRKRLDATFKAFGAVAILIAVLLSVAVIALTDPLGGYVTSTPAAAGTLVFGGLLVAVGYAAYTLRRE
ncbi:fatty acid desaturase [Halorubrum alkaliphilum]|uniref:Fatty acid desaturase n=1 Tax=Halorubrum alkaliphilum TaxID=261290 RepID=A0A8T4GK26_9EURY|nr:hypothetical protein [Halorubrum alkaliphilum]MBP1923365.1 fatty acid desaturase [Halorubrum alkaliphilum]